MHDYYPFIMNRLFHPVKVGLLVIVFCLMNMTGYGGQRQGDSVEVDTGMLLEYPQKYWSQAIMFEDVILGIPSGRTISIGRKSYQSFETEELGTCYISGEHAALMASVEPGKKYLFQGTVLHQQKSFFSKSPEFFVAVQAFTPAQVVDADSMQRMVHQPASAAGSIHMADIIDQVQKELFVFAQGRGLDVQDVLTDETARQDVLTIVHAGIMSVEREQRMTLQTIVSEFILELIGDGTVDADSLNMAGGTRVTEELVEFSDGAAGSPDLNAVDRRAEINASAADIRKRAATIVLKPGVRKRSPKKPLSSQTMESPAPDAGGTTDDLLEELLGE